jgi:serine/threonine-protein phosphatase PGAM5
MVRITLALLFLACICAAVQGEPAAPPVSPVTAPRFTRTIYLIRHGDYEMTPQGDEDVINGLTPLGLAQARLIAARLRGMPVEFPSLTSSTMTRARETAQVIGQRFPQLKLQTTAQLRECLPRTQRADVMKGATPAELDAAEIQLNRAFASWFVPAKGADQHDIVVCHGNVIRYFVMKALGVDPQAWLGLSVAHCSLTIIQVPSAGAFKVLAVGDTGHIPPNLLSGLSKMAPELTAPKATP